MQMEEVKTQKVENWQKKKQVADTQKLVTWERAWQLKIERNKKSLFVKKFPHNIQQNAGFSLQKIGSR